MKPPPDREKAWEQLLALLDRVHARMPLSQKSSREEEAEIARMVKAFRKRRTSI
jgi:hypothetical protein